MEDCMSKNMNLPVFYMVSQCTQLILICMVILQIKVSWPGLTNLVGNVMLRRPNGIYTNNHTKCACHNIINVPSKLASFARGRFLCNAFTPYKMIGV